MSETKPRCAHANGCLSELFQGRGQFFISDGKITVDCSKDDPTGIWEFKCEDCGVFVRASKRSAPNWMRRYIETQEEYANCFKGASSHLT